MKPLYIIGQIIIGLIIVGCSHKTDNFSKEVVSSFMQEQLLDTVDLIMKKRFQYEYGESMTVLFLVAQASKADTLLQMWLTNDPSIEFPYDNHYIGSLCYKDCEVVLNYVRPLAETSFVNESLFDSNRLDSLKQLQSATPVTVEAQALYYSYLLSTQSGITLLDSKEFNLSPLYVE